MNELLKNAFDCIRGRTIWFVQQPFGSYLSLEMGTITTSVDEKIRPYEIESHTVQRRTALVRHSHGIDLNLCEWELYAGEDLIGHSESDRDHFFKIKHWLRGQHAVELLALPENAYVLDLDLGARFHLRPYADGAPDDQLFIITHDSDCTEVLANGGVQTERRDGAQ